MRDIRSQALQPDLEDFDKYLMNRQDQEQSQGERFEEFPRIAVEAAFSQLALRFQQVDPHELKVVELRRQEVQAVRPKHVSNDQLLLLLPESLKDDVDEERAA